MWGEALRPVSPNGIPRWGRWTSWCSTSVAIGDNVEERLDGLSRSYQCGKIGTSQFMQLRMRTPAGMTTQRHDFADILRGQAGVEYALADEAVGTSNQYAHCLFPRSWFSMLPA